MVTEITSSVLGAQKVCKVKERFFGDWSIRLGNELVSWALDPGCWLHNREGPELSISFGSHRIKICAVSAASACRHHCSKLRENLWFDIPST